MLGNIQNTIDCITYLMKENLREGGSKEGGIFYRKKNVILNYSVVLYVDIFILGFHLKEQAYFKTKF